MSMLDFEWPDAKTPSRKSGTSCILRRPFSILLRYAHTTNSAAPAWRATPTRSHSSSPWSDFAAGSNAPQGRPPAARSEEHTSELQSRLHLVCRLLLEKKKRSTPPHHPLCTNHGARAAHYSDTSPLVLPLRFPHVASASLRCRLPVVARRLI